MTIENIQKTIQSLEDRIQRKKQEMSRDEAAILKCDRNVMSAEQSMTRFKSATSQRIYQRRIDREKKEKLRQQENKNKHQQELNLLEADLNKARRQLNATTITADSGKTMMPSANIEKIYQIFVSSTYEDLKMERQEVMAAVVSTGNVPIGMEYFPAGNAAPFDYIKKQIDGADYYILIVAGKYGSINSETGISYTEMEFNYAVEKNVPIAVLQYKDLNKLPGEKLEIENANKRQLLEAFRQNSKKGRMATFWEDAKDLRMQVKDAINSMIVESPRTGWIRADKAVTISQKQIDEDLLEKTIPLRYSEFGIFGLSSVDIALLPESITIAELLKIVVPILRIPKVESAIDDALKSKYEYLKDESIEMAKLSLLKFKLVETNTLVMQNEGVYTAWSVTPKALELWSTSIEL